MKKTLVLAAFAALALVSAQQADARRPRHLVILHTNDTHSHLDPLRSGKKAGHLGVIERAAYFDEVRAAEGRRNVLILDAGDFDQGTPYFSILGGDLEVELLGRMGYDAVAYGNHEFDNGTAELARRVKNMKPEALCANYDFSALELGKYTKPCTVTRRGGYKIGIIGLLADVRTLVDKSVAVDLVYLDPKEVTQKWADHLRNEKKCDLVIVLSHLGTESSTEYSDCKLAEDTEGIDIIIGGHTHTDLDRELVLTNKAGKPVHVVTDFKWGYYVGRLDVTD